MMIIMSLLKKKKQQCEIPLLMIIKFLHTLVLCVNIYGIMHKEAYHTLTYERCTPSLIYNIFLSFQ